VSSARARICNAANWLVAHRLECTYAEKPPALRVSCVHKPYEVPFVSDCSSGVTDLFSWGGANDPNGFDFGGDPYTGTLVARGKLIAAHRARSADVAIFGPYTGWHAGLVLQGGADPLIWSMGEQGDPRIYRASVVERAVAYVNHVESAGIRYFRFNTSKRKS
jgi:hypothetical protein